jgi:FtsH-binding integral membrane protein
VAGLVLGLALAIVGIVLSLVGMSQAKKRNAPQGLAIAGAIIGVVGFVLWLIIFVLILQMD